MSQKLENIFKEALQNQEAPYSPQAWDALSNSLDKTMPVAGKKPFGPKAALILAVGILGATSAWYFTSSSTDSTEKEVITAESNDTNKSKSNNVLSIDGHENTTAKTANTPSTDFTADLADNAQKENKPLKNTSSHVADKTNKNKQIDESASILKMNTLDPNTITSPSPMSHNPAEGEFKTFNTSLPLVENTCQFATTDIRNTSDVRLHIEFPSGKQTLIAPKSAARIKFDESGRYRTYNAEEKEGSFFVYDNAATEFTVDNINSYKNGLPSKEVKLISPVESAEWSCANNKQYYKGAQANFIFFKKGTYDIQVKTTNVQGCTTQTSKTVTVDEDYNLLATSGFKPNDLNPKNNRFMPQALKDRATEFTLVILDPKDGGVIYETSDATEGWDGVDRRNGNPAVNGANYIWKVTVKNTYPGEKHDYKGILTVILD